jgi:hypothetical protein
VAWAMDALARWGRVVVGALVPGGAEAWARSSAREALEAWKVGSGDSASGYPLARLLCGVEDAG